MLTLKLYPSEFRELIGYLRVNTEYQKQVPLRLQLVGKLVMLNYLARWTPIRIYAWKHRKANREFALRLPVVVGLAIYQDMQQEELTSLQQLLLNKLDLAVVDYRHPSADLDDQQEVQDSLLIPFIRQQ